MAKNRRRKTWMQSHQEDPYVKLAQAQGWRSRAVFKLKEIDEKDHLFKGCKKVVDLGSSPGGWSQYIRRQHPSIEIYALDILPMDPIDGVHFIQGDFSEQEPYEKLNEILGDQKVDLVISDMAPNITGIKHVDQLRVMELAELSLEFCKKALKTEGSFCIKVFQGAGIDQFRRSLGEIFRNVAVRKPKASKLHSSEVYLLARNLCFV